jgi:hypothetical protein
MTPEINLASVPSDPKAALGYAELHALWKADEDAYNAGRRISNAEFLIWMGTVRLYLTGNEMALFDQSTQDDLTNEDSGRRREANWRVERGPPAEGHGQYLIPKR